MVIESFKKDGLEFGCVFFSLVLSEYRPHTFNFLYNYGYNQDNQLLNLFFTWKHAVKEDPQE